MADDEDAEKEIQLNCKPGHSFGNKMNTWRNKWLHSTSAMQTQKASYMIVKFLTFKDGILMGLSKVDESSKVVIGESPKIAERTENPIFLLNGEKHVATEYQIDLDNNGLKVLEYEKFPEWLTIRNVPITNLFSFDSPPLEPECDCGAKKANTNHIYWCSTLKDKK